MRILTSANMHNLKTGLFVDKNTTLHMYVYIYMSININMYMYTSLYMHVYMIIDLVMYSNYSLPYLERGWFD